MTHMRVAIMLGLVFIIKEFGLILVTTVVAGIRSYTLPMLCICKYSAQTMLDVPVRWLP